MQRLQVTWFPPQPTDVQKMPNLLLSLSGERESLNLDGMESSNMACGYLRLRVTYLLWLFLSLCVQLPALGFTCSQINSSSHRSSLSSSAKTSSSSRVLLPVNLKLSSPHSIFMSKTSYLPRSDFLCSCLSSFIALTPSAAHAFDGGIGGLGTQKSFHTH